MLLARAAEVAFTRYSDHRLRAHFDVIIVRNVIVCSRIQYISVESDRGRRFVGTGSILETSDCVDGNRRGGRYRQRSDFKRTYFVAVGNSVVALRDGQHQFILPYVYRIGNRNVIRRAYLIQLPGYRRGITGIQLRIHRIIRRLRISVIREIITRERNIQRFLNNSNGASVVTGGYSVVRDVYGMRRIAYDINGCGIFSDFLYFHPRRER